MTRGPNRGIVPLRPLGVGEILDGAFTAIRWNPKAILIPSVSVSTIFAVLSALFSYLLRQRILPNVHVSGSSAPVTTAWGIALLALGGLTLIVALFGNAVLTGLLTITIGHGVFGRKATLASMWRAARPRIWRLIAALLLVTVFVAGGWALAVGLSVLLGVLLSTGAHLPAVGILVGVLCGLAATVFAGFVAIRWSLTIPVVMLERGGPLNSMGRSWRLVRRSFWRVLGILLLAQLVAGIVNGIIEIPFLVAGGGVNFTGTPVHTSIVGLALSAVGSIIANTVTVPLLAGAIVLLYADLRMRREGMDLALQAGVTGVTAVAGATGATAATGAAPDGQPGGQNAGPW